jgi:glycosyltransferase involved in cell wall biosynthesis
MRIAILSPDLYRLWDGQRLPTGGTETHMANLARALAAHHEVVVVTAGEPRRPLAAPAGVQVLRLGHDPSGRPFAAAAPGFARGVLRALRTADPDWVLQLGVGYSTLLATLFCRGSGSGSRSASRPGSRRRFAFLWGNVTDATGRDSGKPGVMDRLLVWARRQADLQVCQTDQQLALLRPEERARACIVPNPLNTALDWPLAYGDAVLWVGWVRPERKRPDRFLRVAARLPHRRFLMVGGLGGDAAFQEWFRSELARLPNVIYDGFVAEADLPDTYARARMLLNTSDVEGFPNTFLEAMACGVPVVSFRFDPNGILAGGAGTCADGDEERLVAAVEAMFEGPRHAAFRASALRVADEHRPERILARLEQALAGASA